MEVGVCFDHQFLRTLLILVLGLGHISRSCKEERADGNERVEIKCSNCDGLGHRVRDCREQRKNKHGCRNCGYVALRPKKNVDKADFYEDLWSTLLLTAPSLHLRLMLNAGSATRVSQDHDQDAS